MAIILNSLGASQSIANAFAPIPAGVPPFPTEWVSPFRHRKVPPRHVLRLHLATFEVLPHHVLSRSPTPPPGGTSPRPKVPPRPDRTLPAGSFSQVERDEVARCT